jgi:hypothetical protein
MCGMHGESVEAGGRLDGHGFDLTRAFTVEPARPSPSRHGSRFTTVSRGFLLPHSATAMTHENSHGPAHIRAYHEAMRALPLRGHTLEPEGTLTSTQVAFSFANNAYRVIRRLPFRQDSERWNPRRSDCENRQTRRKESVARGISLASRAPIERPHPTASHWRRGSSPHCMETTE